MIVATGIEHSGTSVLSRILKTSGEEVRHMAQPHVANGELVWWDASDLPEDTRYVVIVRREDCREATSLQRGQSLEVVRERYEEARSRLARLPAITVSYELLVREPDIQVQNLAHLLGVSLHLPEDIYDANEQWLAPIETAMPPGFVRAA